MKENIRYFDEKGNWTPEALKEYERIHIKMEYLRKYGLKESLDNMLREGRF